MSNPAPVSSTSANAACRTIIDFCGSDARSPVDRVTPRKASAGSALRRGPGRHDTKHHAGRERQQEREPQHCRAKASPGWRCAPRRGMPAPELSVFPRKPRPIPARPPIHPSSKLSVSIWRISLDRAEPSAMRTDVSAFRFIPRASIRLATLAHATRSTSAEIESSR